MVKQWNLYAIIRISGHVKRLYSFERNITTSICDVGMHNEDVKIKLYDGLDGFGMAFVRKPFLIILGDTSHELSI